MRILLSMIVMYPLCVYSKPPCPDYDPSADVPQLRSLSDNILTRAFDNGHDQGVKQGLAIKKYFFNAFGSCLPITRMAKESSDITGMVIGELGYGINVATNKSPFRKSRFNQITWSIDTVKGCAYDMYITYASGISKRVKLTVNGKKIKGTILMPSTGGYCPSQQARRRVAIVKINHEITVLQISRNKSLPNIERIELIPK